MRPLVTSVAAPILWTKPTVFKLLVYICAFTFFLSALLTGISHQSKKELLQNHKRFLCSKGTSTYNFKPIKGVGICKLFFFSGNIWLQVIQYIFLLSSFFLTNPPSVPLLYISESFRVHAIKTSPCFNFFFCTIFPSLFLDESCPENNCLYSKVLSLFYFYSYPSWHILWKMNFPIFQKSLRRDDCKTNDKL